jgi:extracellular sulfatase Sulf
MDGKSILPLILKPHRNIKEKWPDTFLIESSGRRETPEQVAEQKARAAAARYAQLLNQNMKFESPVVEVNKTLDLKQKETDFSSHELDELEEDDEEDDGDF